MMIFVMLVLFLSVRKIMLFVVSGCCLRIISLIIVICVFCGGRISWCVMIVEGGCG